VSGFSFPWWPRAKASAAPRAIPADSVETVSDAMPLAEDLNAAIGVFLDNYCASTKPLNYAVLLTGPWGAGKTHFLKGYLAKRNKSYIYVSLYGVTSTTEIDDEIYRQLHPVLASKYTRLGGVILRAVAKGALKLDFNNDGRDDGTLNSTVPEIDLKDFQKNAKEKLLVFDDLERAALKPAQVLGYINAFVEHEDAKAVILANEDELEKGDADFARIKEKLIGQTLQITPSVEAAYPQLVELVTDPWTAEFLSASKAQVLDIFALSKAKNLRVLKQALWDFERVAKGFRTSDHDHPVQLTQMLQAILALSIEVRTGRLPKEQLANLTTDIWARGFRRGKGKEKSELEVSEERYPGVALCPSTLAPELAQTLFTRGYVDAAAVQASLDRSPPFITLDEEPSWRRAWHGYQSSDAEYAAAMTALEADFAARTFVEPRVILHIFGILLNAARIGYGARSIAQTLAACRAYVDDLAADNRLELRPARPDPLQTDTGYGGLGFIEKETSEFIALKDYFEEVIEKAWLATLPTVAANLHEVLKATPEKFTQQTTINNGTGGGAFWDVPLLAQIDPADFTKTILALDATMQGTVIHGLMLRYQRQPSSPVKTVELPWLAKVHALLVAAIPSLGPMSQYRLKTLLSRDIEPLLPAAAAAPTPTRRARSASKPTSGPTTKAASKPKPAPKAKP
jgi:hypothetical protein